MAVSQAGSVNLDAFLEEVRPAIDRTLDQILPKEDEAPSKLHQAMRYSGLAGGKRLRPVLCVAGYAAFRDDWKRVLPVAAALELVHAYSLIHDDLPALDNDSFRRGIPSCHKVYGDGIAMLAGNGLLSLAFETLATADFSDERVREITLQLARASGTRRGMMAGQVLDLLSNADSISEVELEKIHKYKTGALLEASVTIGAYLADADDAAVVRMGEYGSRVGLAFQIMDDILDVTASSEVLGKTSGKDLEQRKATYPTIAGIEMSREVVKRLTAEARAICNQIGPGGHLLASIADYLENRSS